MPPKGWKKYPDGFKPVNSAGTPLKDREKYTLEDLLLPRSTVIRLAKEVLPEGSQQLPKEAVLALLRSSTVFINYLGSEANTVAHDTFRKTLTAADVFRALEMIDFGAFVPNVQAQLASTCGTYVMDVYFYSGLT
jgi:DNA polymerase epsilon subunit 3